MTFKTNKSAKTLSGFWSPTAAKSSAASRAPPGGWAGPPSPSTPTRTAARGTCAWRTRPTISAPLPPRRAISISAGCSSWPRRVGADAVHPGYGFLSENADFAQACLDAGLVFVGPPPAAIRAMGSKSASKAAMAAVGVPVAPGYHGGEQSLERLEAEAQRVGFPLIIKASAGGGGKGMQVVHSAGDVAAAVSRRSGWRAPPSAMTGCCWSATFRPRGTSRCRYSPTLMAASWRCSTGIARCSAGIRRSSRRRRRRGCAGEVREAMAQAAITAARAVGYVGAGTVEFLLDPEQNFYFMEMNTGCRSSTRSPSSSPASIWSNGS